MFLSPASLPEESDSMVRSIPSNFVMLPPSEKYGKLALYVPQFKPLLRLSLKALKKVVISAVLCLNC